MTASSRTPSLASLCRVGLLATSVAALSACGLMGGAKSGPSATAQLAATKGNAVTGTVTFKQSGEHMVIAEGRVEGLKPGQEHGFHVHEKGDCSSGDGMGTGGHFNPTGKPHGPRSGEHHAGDLPALKADATGTAVFRVELHGVTVAPGLTSVVGRGLIVHAGPDDYTTQPTGNSGARIACGVIVLN